MMDAADLAARGQRLQAYIHTHIPLVRQMRVRVEAFDPDGLSLTAPLAPNINHERSAFGGSLSSLATLACWGYLWLLLEGESGLHIVVNEAEMKYLKPVTGELLARCPAPPAAELRKFQETLARRGKARLRLQAEIVQDGRSAARYAGLFVAYREAAD